MCRLAHNVLITYMLTEVHSEYDAPWSMHNVAPSIFGGALRHRYHHAYTQRGFKGGRKGVHYHEFFRYLDQFFGFEVSKAECRRYTTTVITFLRANPSHNYLTLTRSPEQSCSLF